MQKPPLRLPNFLNVPSIVHGLYNSHYFTVEDWGKWFDFYEFSSRYNLPCDLFRNVEYLYTEKELAPAIGKRVLDIGTGRSVFPGYLAERGHTDFAILDYDPYGFEDQKKIFATVPGARVLLMQGDGTQMPLAEGCIDAISAVSAIEHFPDGGDIKFMHEASRVLRPGGVCVVTVPYAETFQENKDVHHYHGGFERRYPRESLQERLWSAGNWELKNELYMNPGKSAFARRTIARHGKLDNFFDLWYETRSNMTRQHDSLWYTLLLIDLADKPGPGCFGSCFTLIKK